MHILYICIYSHTICATVTAHLISDLHTQHCAHFMRKLQTHPRTGAGGVQFHHLYSVPPTTQQTNYNRHLVGIWNECKLWCRTRISVANESNARARPGDVLTSSICEMGYGGHTERRRLARDFITLVCAAARRTQKSTVTFMMRYMSARSARTVGIPFEPANLH